MEKITVRGIYKDLSISPYKFVTSRFVFHFSSKLYLKKFRERLYDKYLNTNTKIEKRFNFKIYSEDLAAFLLYNEIETRGCYITNIRGEVICQEELVLDGRLEKKTNLEKKFVALTTEEEEPLRKTQTL